MAILAKKIQPSKAQAIEEAKKVLSEYKDFIFVEYRGLTVEQISKLRHSLREKNSQFKVIKNNFARVAFDEMKNDAVAQYLSGPTAIAMIKEEANESAKVLFDFAKETPALVVKGAWVEDELYDAAKIEAFAKLPERNSSSQCLCLQSMDLQENLLEHCKHMLKNWKKKVRLLQLQRRKRQLLRQRLKQPKQLQLQQLSKFSRTNAFLQCPERNFSLRSGFIAVDCPQTNRCRV